MISNWMYDFNEIFDDLIMQTDFVQFQWYPLQFFMVRNKLEIWKVSLYSLLFNIRTIVIGYDNFCILSNLGRKCQYGKLLGTWASVKEQDDTQTGKWQKQKMYIMQR